MIKQIRIESKLYNGNVTIENAHAISAKMILLANDEIAANQFMKKAILAQACPDFNVQIRVVSEAIHLLKDKRAEKLMVQIICSSPKDVIAFLNVFGSVEVIVGRYKKKHAEHKIMLSEQWIIDDKEKEYFDTIYKLSDGLLYGQVLPEHKKQKYMELLKKT